MELDYFPTLYMSIDTQTNKLSHTHTCTRTHTHTHTQAVVIMVGVHDATAEPSLLMSPGWDGGGGVCRRESNVSGNNKNKGGLSGKEE